jgi:hypothetical protein
MPSIINQLRQELREKIKVSHEIVEFVGENEINVDENFKVKFIISNNSEFKVLIKKITVKDTLYAKVIGTNSYNPDVTLERHYLSRPELLPDRPLFREHLQLSVEERLANMDFLSNNDMVILPRSRSTLLTQEFEMKALDTLNTDNREYEEPFAKVIVDASYDPQDILTIQKMETEYLNIHKMIEVG